MNGISDTIKCLYKQSCCKCVTFNQSKYVLVAHIITYSWFRHFGHRSRPTRHKTGIRVEEFRYHNVGKYLYPANKKTFQVYV